MSGKKGMRKYPVELKLEAVRLYYEEATPYHTQNLQTRQRTPP
jgi:hypothetical protein